MISADVITLYSGILCYQAELELEVWILIDRMTIISALNNLRKYMVRL